MFSRIVSLTILCASLLFAGAPAIACATQLPAHDCCPNGPQGPCELGSSGTTKVNQVAACCSAGMSASTFVGAANSDELQKHSSQADSTPFITIAVMPSVVHRQSAYYAAIASPRSFDSSQRALYLSTGRLRL